MRLAVHGLIAGNDIYYTAQAAIDVRKNTDPLIQVSLMFSFVLFSDTWPHEGYSMSRMTILLFLSLHITRADIRPQVKWIVNLVIADGRFNLPQGSYR